MQLRLDAADRLVELVEERRAPLPAEDAARELFALARSPAGLARTLLDEVVSSDARLAWQGSSIRVAGTPSTGVSLDAATYVVVDLETTGLTPGRAQICEIGAVRLRGITPAGSFQTFANPQLPLPAAIATLTGIREYELRHAPSVETALRRFLAFAGDCVLVAHNARFDLSFLDREVERLLGRRIAAPVVDTAALARVLLSGRVPRARLASLADFFATAARPCHRALPDAQATAEILVALIGLAQERGARSVGDLCTLAAPRARRAHGKRSLAFGAPTRPGVYLFRDRNEQILYVGRARDLRARLRSYFRSGRQRPAVEAALHAVERIEWRVTGSELEAALEELRLLRELRPPANARGTRPDRYVYLARREGGIAVSTKPTPLGPIRSRRRAELAARALAKASPEELERLSSGAPLPRLRARLRDLAECRRYEDAARLRDRIAALERVVHDLALLEGLRVAELCLLAPAEDERFLRAFFVAGGRLAAVRSIPRDGGASLEIVAGIAAARAAAREPVSPAPESADELLLLGAFVRRPPPELDVVPLEETRIAAACRCAPAGAAVA
jgi:DNA polymerase III epsilon subunit family exonuclease